MINTMDADIIQAYIKGIKIKGLINEQFKSKSKESILEVELDGVYRKLLLLKKKKYATLTVQNINDIRLKKQEFVPNLSVEYKGLDLVRRDWSLLTQLASKEVLRILFDSGSLDEVYSYLTKLNESLLKFQ